MISDPKLPFSNEPPIIRELRPPGESPVSAISLPGSGPSRPPSIARLWLRRFAVLLFVFLCATLGVMLMILPWRPEWSDNPLLLSYPTLRALMSSGFARGLATGLGVLNVWIGFWEAIRYQE